MGIFIRVKLARIDKKITHLLRKSAWYQRNKDKDQNDLFLHDIDRNEDWVKEVDKFIKVVWNNKEYRKLVETYGLDNNDLTDFFLIMTIATMPNPLFLTGPSRLSNTLVGTAMYQEIDKQLMTLLNLLGHHDNKEDQEKYGHRYASDVVDFAFHLKYIHEITYGRLTFEEVL